MVHGSKAIPVASPLYPLSASGEGKDEVRGEASFEYLAVLLCGGALHNKY
jgi:hypothetical protein